MLRFHEKTRVTRVVALASTLFVVSGCAHVNEEQLSTEMETLRQEIREQDEAVEQRLSDRIQTMENDIESQIAALESDLQGLEQQFDTTVERLEAAIRFNTPVHFAFDEATVREEDQELLDRFAQIVGAYYGDAVITVEGFTDSAGPAEYNMRLGQERAEAVREYLTSAGIPADRIRAVSYGESAERQVTDEAQGPGQAGWQNRRVSLVIDFRGEVEGTPLAMAEPAS